MPAGVPPALLVVRLVDASGQRTPVTWQLPEEVPVAVLINSLPYTVMMATPADLTDLALGFSLTEELIAAVFAQAEKSGAAMLAIPVHDTVKQVDAQQQVQATFEFIAPF